MSIICKLKRTIFSSALWYVLKNLLQCANQGTLIFTVCGHSKQNEYLGVCITFGMMLEFDIIYSDFAECYSNLTGNAEDYFNNFEAVTFKMKHVFLLPFRYFIRSYVRLRGKTVRILQFRLLQKELFVVLET